MTSPDSHAEQLDTARRLWSGARSRIRAIVRASSLDSDLAAGVQPSASAAHLARADRITRPRRRRRIRAALNRALADSFAPRRRMRAEAPLSNSAIRECRDELSTLAEVVVTTENPRVQGVAIAHQLAFDGRGPLFFQPHTKWSVERLRNTVRAAQTALNVSAEFDPESMRHRETSL